MDNLYGDIYGEMALVFLIGLLFLWPILIIGSYVLHSLSLMLLFKRTDYPSPGHAWIPFYNTYLFYKMGGQQPIWFWISIFGGFLTLIPYIGSFLSFVAAIVTIVSTTYAIIFINNSFGKQNNIVAWTIFGVLILPIWAIVLGVSKDTVYDRAYGPLLLNKEGMPPTF